MLKSGATRIGIILSVLILLSLTVKAQFLKSMMSSLCDTNYISDYTHYVTSRVYGSVKYANFDITDENFTQGILAYRPNNKLMLGFGVNHGILGLNIAFDIPAVNDDNKKFGKTSYLNLTSRIYLRKFSADIYLQVYKGFYLSNSAGILRGWNDLENYYKRPDIRSYNIGLSVNYIYNNGRFSYRAAFLQNEWQKKSAGSVLFGGAVFYTNIVGDTSLIPKNIIYRNFFESRKVKRINMYNLGPMIGYAYTFVIKYHWFLMLSGSANLAIGSTSLITDQIPETKDKSGLTVDFNLNFETSAGYNSHWWYIGFSYTNLSTRQQTPVSKGRLNMDTGNFRFNIVRRFRITKPIRILNPGLNR